jgi:hypothetical protein
MWGGFQTVVIASTILAPSGSLEMNISKTATSSHCTMIGGNALPPALGESEAICRAVEAAIIARSSTHDYRVQVKVASPSRLSADVVVNGRTLPEQRFAVMDGVINSGSIQRFAESIAEVVAAAAK